ncbi:MAG: branched-chain amino acid ABC transporter permease [Sporichthyaceae bacterium]|nr:branched-chain amino acid ABC transporter permease [Sporichthyaceae bacterium]
MIALAAFLGSVVVLSGFGAGTAHAQEVEVFQGQLRSAGQPVPNVQIDVATEADAPVGTATSDAEGRWRIEVPAAGTYKISLNVETLPEGVGLINPAQQTLTVEVFAGNVRNVQFRLAPGGATSVQKPPSKLSRVPQLIFEGFNLGLVIALAAMGLSLIYGTTGLTNFAHGELVTFGAIVAYWFTTSWGGLNLIPAACLAVIVSGMFGYGQDRWFWGKLRKRGTGIIAMMIVSIGLALVLRNIFQIRFEGRTRQYQDYNALEGIDFGPFTANWKTMIGMAVCIVVIVALASALLFTRLGKATRAVADNPSLAAASGINVERVIRLVWTVGAAAAGLAGIVLGMSQGVRFTMGAQVLLLIFAGVTLGGLGTAFGALVGSLIVGLFIQLSTLFVAEELKIAGALLVMIVVLLVRPQGILGRRERIG